MNQDPSGADVHHPETPAELRRFLESIGRRPTKALGQNFLIDRNLTVLVAESAELAASDRAVEVGPGLGALTRHLVPRAGFVRAVERDRFLLAACQRLLPPGERLAYWQGDVLAGKRALDPDLVRTLATDREARPELVEKWVSNLPYNVAGPLLAILLSTRDPVRRITVTIQKEMADRLAARPGGSEYGPLAILAGLAATVRVVRVFGPGAFWPPPRVHSAIVDLVVRPDRPAGLPALAGWLPALFGQRRKTLAGALVKSTFPDRTTAEMAERVAGLGIDPRARPQDLRPEEFLELIRLE